MSGPRVRDYKKIKSDDPVINRIQDQVGFAIDQLLHTEIFDGRLLKGVSLTKVGSSNPVAHKLGRTPIGWLVVGKTSDSRVWSISRDSLFLNLETSAVCSVDLWVF